MDFYVTCRLYGQLGNQLFQIATTLSYAWDYGAIPVFPELHKEEDLISYNRDRIFFRLNASMPPRPFQEVFQESVYYSPERIPFKKDLILNGHFQSWRHFHHHRDKLLDIFAPAKPLQDKYASLLSRPNLVGVHVRTHSKHLHENGLHPFTGFQYYQEAFALFPGATFVFFSDRISWCKKAFAGENRIFIEGNDAVEDLFLFSMLPHQIFGNSTYGWWGGYLNQNPHKRVVSPKEWKPGGFPTDDFFLPDWTLLPVGFDHPYPEGLERERTTSVNN